MLEPWNTLASVMLAVAVQMNGAFEAGKVVGAAECRAAAPAHSKADRDFFRGPRLPEQGNKRY